MRAARPNAPSASDSAATCSGPVEIPNRFGEALIEQANHLDALVFRQIVLGGKEFGISRAVTALGECASHLCISLVRVLNQN